MARTPDGPPPPPAVQRLRLRYAKRGRLRFSSHRDFQRAFERALRRAAIEEEPDDELDAYNNHLAQLHAQDQRQAW